MDADPPLVLAMPRRELFRIQGYVPPNDLAVLESLAEESWFATPELLAADIDAKEVRLGLVVVRRDEVLIDADGVLLHATSIPPSIGGLGSSSLAALRSLALRAGQALLGITQGQVELAGFCNEDAMVECRGIFVLVYRYRAPERTDAPAGLSWVSRHALSSIPIDPVSALVVDAVR